MLGDMGRKLHVQCQDLIPALNAWVSQAKYMTAHPIDNHFPWHGRMADLTTERSLIRKLHHIDVLSLFY